MGNKTMIIWTRLTSHQVQAERDAGFPSLPGHVQEVKHELTVFRSRHSNAPSTEVSLLRYDRYKLNWCGSCDRHCNV